MSTQVAPPLQASIHAFKDALAGAVDEVMACAPPGEAATALKSRLNSMLDADEKPNHQSISTPGTDKTLAVRDNIYGSNLKAEVSAPTNAPALRAVEVSYENECGNDTVFLLYEPHAQGWKQVLRWQSGDYKEVSGAFGDLYQYDVLPDSAHGLRLVVAHGTPWCISRFSGFSIDLLAPAGRLDQVPRVLWHTARGYSRGDYPARLRATPDGFEFRVNAPATDSDAYERTVIYHYRVVDDHVTRTGPIATNGRGFVEEWLEMPWDEAKEVTTPESVAGMKPFHDHVEAQDKKPETYISHTYGAVRSCLSKGLYQVEMHTRPGGREFFFIEEGKTGYTMMNYSQTEDERCTGPDLMNKH